MGFGVGGTTIGFDPLGNLDDDGATLEARIKGKAGPAGSLELGFDIGECADVNFKGNACVGLACAKLDELFLKRRPETGLSGKAPKPFQPSHIKGEKSVVTGKFAGKFCQKANW